MRALPQRVLGDAALEFGHELPVAAEGEVGVHQRLERGLPQFLQACDLALREGVAREVRQRVSAPQPQRRAELARRTGGVAGPQRRESGCVGVRSASTRFVSGNGSRRRWYEQPVLAASARRTLETCTWMAFTAVAVVPPHSAIASRSVLIGSPACRTSIASKARGLAPPERLGSPRQTSNGPRIRKSTAVTDATDCTPGCQRPVTAFVSGDPQARRMTTPHLTPLLAQTIAAERRRKR